MNKHSIVALVLLCLVLLPSNVISQIGDSNQVLQHKVLDWELGFFICRSIDSQYTGMRLVPSNTDPKDTLLQFSFAGISARMTSNWYAYSTEIRNLLPNKSFAFPDSLIVEVDVLAYTNVYDARIGFGMYDTISGSSGFSYENLDLKPGIQKISIPFGWYPGLKINEVHALNIIVIADTPLDSQYTFMRVNVHKVIRYYKGSYIIVDDFDQTATSVETQGDIPEGFILNQNYPNPFNPTTTIRYEVPVAGDVRLQVYSVTGEEVAVLVDQFQQAGVYETTFDGSNLPSGTYIYALSCNGQRQSRKMLLVK